jgi:hypothetical protein
MCHTLSERADPQRRLGWLMSNLRHGLRREAAAELNLADAFFADPPVGEDTNRR